ncbi:MAG: hypothetical protein J5I98_16790 [Phaeodactylibacter sp.]|nr:hypothetical protein [Phaeodactylibacter sp.]
MTSRLQNLWAQGLPAYNFFLTIPNAWTAELMARAGFDAVTLDMQHGLIDFATALQQLQAISTTETVPLVRLQWNEPSIVMKMLDAGAAGLICPMIDTADDAADFVRACRYPPAGIRSYGPIRAGRLAPGDYFRKANEDVLAFAMIETASAAENLEAIAAVPGLSGLFVGPFDLSISLGLEWAGDIHDPALQSVLKRVLAACGKHGLIPGVYGGSVPHMLDLAGMGFRLVSTGDDTKLLEQGARGVLEELRGSGR